MKLKRPDCGQVADYPGLPAPTLTNTPSCSVAIFDHPHPVSCLCGARLVPVLASVERCAFAAAKIERRAPSRIVIPGRL